MTSPVHLRLGASIVVLALVGCGPTSTTSDAAATGATGGDATTDTPLTTTSSTGTIEPTSSSSTGSSDSTTWVEPVWCGADFSAVLCERGWICVERAHPGPTDWPPQDCVPNPDGCVPDFPCSPACQTLCKIHSIGVCSEDNADTPAGLLHCPQYIACDVWNPDCPDGRKCSPPGSCEKIADEPAAVGEPCLMDPDSCAEHLFCVNFESPWTAETGTCLALCAGTPAMPSCAADYSCLDVSQNLDVNTHLCFPTCYPVKPDCPATDTCIPNPHDESEFICFHNFFDGALFSPCQRSWACAPGLFCGEPTEAIECDLDEPGCCLPYCDLNDPTCPGAGQQCVPWHTDGPAPPGLEDVGKCALP